MSSSSILLRLFVLIVVLAAVSSSHVERQRRASRFTRFWQKVGKGIKDTAVKVGKGIKDVSKKVGTGIKKAATVGLQVAKGSGLLPLPLGLGFGIPSAVLPYTWVFNVVYKAADTEEEEAEIILTATDRTIDEGGELITKAQQLLNKAADLEQSLVSAVGKRDVDKRAAKGMQGVIDAIRNAAGKAISAGKKIIANSEKIKAALVDAVGDIKEVVSEGLVDVGGAISELGDSVSDAGQKLGQAKTAADNANDGLGDFTTELQNASDMSVEAYKSFEEVGQRSLNLFERIVKFGKNLFKVFKQAAQNISKAAGKK